MQLNPITLVPIYRQCQDIWYTVVIILDGHKAALLHVSSQEPPMINKHAKLLYPSSFILTPQVQLEQCQMSHAGSPESIRRDAMRVATACHYC